jgi:hypothetical protein
MVLAQHLEQASDALMAVVEQCSPAELTARCAQCASCVAAGCTVAGAAYHVAVDQCALEQWLRRLACGEDWPFPLRRAGYRDARYAVTTRDATLSLLRQNRDSAASFVRGLSDEQLDRSAPVVPAGGRPWSLHQLIEGMLIVHTETHCTSIEATVLL